MQVGQLPKAFQSHYERNKVDVYPSGLVTI